VQKAAPTCTGCGNPIRSDYVQVDGKPYHTACFKCSSCSQPIQGKYMIVKGGKGHLCWKCQPRCCACQQPLAGCSVIKVDGKTMHASCFKCSSCGTTIGDDGHFKVNPGTYHCSRCHAREWKASEDAEIATAMKRERRLKRHNSSAYRLYWRPEIVPSSRKTLMDMGVQEHDLPAAQQVCICRDVQSGGITCAPAPAGRKDAAVNVSYLATALHLLTSFGREPQFSLDPVDPHNLSGDLQVKRFYPSWLAGTIVGEVLFQADYALKQLCLGDLTLPGLPNAMDDWEFKQGEEVAARQWFVIRHGWVTVASDGAILPHCEMAVEARRLVPSADGYKDAAYTDPREPMVRTASAITEHFQSVAEQLPVVGELLALAKAIVVARYLLETGSACDSSVLAHFQQPRCPEGDEYRLEIPTLRMEHRTSAVKKTGAQLIMERQSRCIHGGVDLGLPSPRVMAKPLAKALLEPQVKHTKLPLFSQPPRAALAA